MTAENRLLRKSDVLARHFLSHSSFHRLLSSNPKKEITLPRQARGRSVR